MDYFFTDAELLDIADLLVNENNILLELGNRSVTAGVRPGIEDEYEIPSYADLIYTLRVYLFRNANPRNLTLAAYEAQTRVVPVVILSTGESSVDPDRNRREIYLRDLDYPVISRIKDSMETSGDREFEIQEVKIRLLLLNDPVGAANEDDVTENDVAYKDPITFMIELTQKTQRLKGVKINCMAFCLAYKVLNLNNPKRDLKKICEKAIEIQQMCGFKDYVAPSEVQKFVDVYNTYRVTVILKGTLGHSYNTVTGRFYNLQFKRNGSNDLTDECKKKTIYILYSPAKRHYGLPKPRAGPCAMKKEQTGQLRWHICHKCLNMSSTCSVKCSCVLSLSW